MDGPNDGAYARQPEVSDLVRICRALNEAGARYLLIGGFAVIAHGGSRTTKDIDLLVDDSVENVARVKAALAVLADNAAAEVNDDDVQRYAVVRVAAEVVVALLGRVCGLSYEELAGEREWVALEDIRVPVAGKSALIRTKQTSRPLDAADRLFLEERIASEKRRRS